MRINAQETLYNKLVNTNIFGNTQFPVGYWFPQDRNTGVIRRSFIYSPNGAGGNFILVNPSTAQVLQLTGSDCGQETTRLEAVPDSTAITTRHQFYLDSKTQQIMSVDCSGLVVTSDSDNCSNCSSLVLRLFNPSSPSNPNAWRYYKNRLVFDKCISSASDSNSEQELAITSVKKKTKYVKITLVGEGQVLLTRYVNVYSESGKLISKADNGATASQSSTYEDNKRKHNATIAIMGIALDGGPSELDGGEYGKQSQHCGIKAGEDKYDEDRDKYYYNCFQRTSKEKDPWLKVNLSEEDVVAKVDFALPIDLAGELPTGWHGMWGTIKIQLFNSDDIVVKEKSVPLSGFSKTDWTIPFVGYTNVILQKATESNNAQQWIPSFVEPPYHYGLVPGFAEMASSGHGKNRMDAIKSAKAAMVTCDKSMSLLVGSQTSVGSLRALADLVKDGGPMPGQCCFDTPTSNPQFFGFSVSSCCSCCCDSIVETRHNP